MLKKIVLLLLSVLLVLSFASCKWGNKADKDNSSSDFTSDILQDYDNDFGEDDELTEDEKEELEDLWNQATGNGNSSIVASSGNGSSSEGSSSQGSSSQGSSSQGSSSQGSSSNGSSGNSGSGNENEFVGNAFQNDTNQGINGKPNEWY